MPDVIEESVPKFLERDALPGRLFAIGDIHGCVDELVVMLEFVSNELGFGENDSLVFIGDYIDRGPASKEVIDVVMSFRERFGENVIFLKGNHEDMLLSYLGFPGSLGAGYLANGGQSCFNSYGIERGLPPEEALALMPEEHLTFYRTLQRYALIGEFIFVHAGLNPLRDLRFQLDEDLFWIRDEFIQNMHYFKKTIVFGHTPFEDILFHLPYKIGIDTGLVYGNALTCIECTSEVVYQISTGDNEVVINPFLDKGGVWPQYG